MASKGQSTLEYILVVSAILAAIIAVVSTSMSSGVNETMTKSKNIIENSTTALTNRLGL